MKKRIMGMLVMLVLVGGIGAMPVLADPYPFEKDTDGTILIDTVAELTAFATEINDDTLLAGTNARLTEDIALNVTTDIPVEARKELLDITRRAIFEKGQGVDPQPEQFGNASGVALKFMYSLLELKAGLLETEFRLGFGDFIRAICQYLRADCKTIIQTWTRTAITNDTELSEICKGSVGIVSEKSILANHPFVENVQTEIKEIEDKRLKELDSYGAFPLEV